MKKNNNYNICTDRHIFIETFLQKLKPKTVIDVGCGSGHYLKHFINNWNVFGIEISNICCDKYLSELPHENIDLVSFSKSTDKRFDCLYCFDVLEHIKYEDLNEFISCLVKISDNILLGIANHSDIQLGIELHIIQQNNIWWQNKLKNYFKEVTLIENENRFFVLECKK